MVKEDNRGTQNSLCNRRGYSEGLFLERALLFIKALPLNPIKKAEITLGEIRFFLFNWHKDRLLSLCLVYSSSAGTGKVVNGWTLFSAPA